MEPRYLRVPIYVMDGGRGAYFRCTRLPPGIYTAEHSSPLAGDGKLFFFLWFYLWRKRKQLLFFLTMHFYLWLFFILFCLNLHLQLLQNIRHRHWRCAVYNTFNSKLEPFLGEKVGTKNISSYCCRNISSQVKFQHFFL